MEKAIEGFNQEKLSIINKIAEMENNEIVKMGTLERRLQEIDLLILKILRANIGM